jgi:hypothetical protein
MLFLSLNMHRKIQTELLFCRIAALARSRAAQWAA